MRRGGPRAVLPQNAGMPRPQIRCTVSTRFLPEQSSAQDGVYAFAYTIEIRNTGDIAAQVVGRRWRITHGSSGLVEEVRTRVSKNATG